MTRLTVHADEDGVISGVQGDVETMTGWTEAELIGQDIDTVIPPKYRESHHSALDSYVSTGRKKTMGSWVAVECLRKDRGTVLRSYWFARRTTALQGIMEEP